MVAVCAGLTTSPAASGVAVLAHAIDMKVVAVRVTGEVAVLAHAIDMKVVAVLIFAASAAAGVVQILMSLDDLCM